MATNNVLYKGGIWEYIPGFQVVTSEVNTLKAFILGDDFVGAEAYLESLYGATWQDLAIYQNVSLAFSQANEQVLESDNCSVGEALRTNKKLVTLGVDLFETDNIDFFAQILGLTVQTTTAVPVGPVASTQTSGTWAFSTPFRAGSTKDATAVAIATVAGSVDGALVLDTDYIISTDADGHSTITIIDSTTVTTTVQDITFDITYTPVAGKATGFCVESSAVPYNLFKFTTCPNENGEVNVYYIYKSALNSDYTMTFANTDRDGQSFVSSSITFESANGGVFLYDKGTLTA